MMKKFKISIPLIFIEIICFVPDFSTNGLKIECEKNASEISSIELFRIVPKFHMKKLVIEKVFPISYFLTWKLIWLD